MNAKNFLLIVMIGFVFSCKKEDQSTPAPTAVFKANVTLVNITDTVKFTNLSTNVYLNDTTFVTTWYFSGGTPSKSKDVSPSVIYYTPGQYSVKLVISNKNGKDSITKTNYITVQSTLNDGLVAYYPFNGNANDESGNGNNGIVNGAMPAADKNGVANSAYSFNGNNSYIDIPSNNLKLATFSYSVWFRIKQIPAIGYLNAFNILNIGGNGGNIMVVYSNSYGISILGFGDATSPGPSPITSCLDTIILNPDKWYHLVCTSNNKKSKMFLNNTLVSSTMTMGTPDYGTGNYPATIGSRLNQTQFFNGEIDEVRIYNRVLTNKEIAELKNLN